jgi:flavin reductase (DIM6/NTAB) family NADH-FMN oxidoreductase RutF/DNA-binding MarR family transcriptional regulator
MNGVYQNLHLPPDHATESGHPLDDPAAYRRSLAQFATGVAVVTTRVGDILAAMTSNSFSSVSLDPPLILWSIRRESKSFAVFEQAVHFAVNILSAEQVELSQNFARSGPDKFHGVAWRPGIDGVPILDGIVASLECRTQSIVDGGDHVIVIGKVERHCRYDRQPLLFAQGRYAIVADYPENHPIGICASGAVGGAGADMLMTPLFLRAYKSMAAGLEEARKRGGVSLLESILLRAVSTMPGRTLEELLPEMLVGMNAGYGVYEQLLSRGLVEVDVEGKLFLTNSGNGCIEALICNSLETEREVFSDLSSTDLAAARRVLRAIISR